jgi:hypothetical protein
VPVGFAIALNHENPEIVRVLFENQRFATVEFLQQGQGEGRPGTNPRRWFEETITRRAERTRA